MSSKKLCTKCKVGILEHVEALGQVNCSNCGEVFSQNALADTLPTAQESHGGRRRLMGARVNKRGQTGTVPDANKRKGSLYHNTNPRYRLRMQTGLLISSALSEMIPKNTIENIKSKVEELFTTVEHEEDYKHKYRYGNGRHQFLIAISMSYLVIKSEAHPVSLREVLTRFNEVHAKHCVMASECSAHMRYIQRKMKFVQPIGKLSPEKFFDRMLELLHMHPDGVKLVLLSTKNHSQFSGKATIKKRGQILLKVSKHFQLSEGRNPATILAACLYTAARCSGYRLELSQVANHVHHAERVIKARVRELKKSVLDFSKPVLPFAQTLTLNSIDYAAPTSDPVKLEHGSKSTSTRVESVLAWILDRFEALNCLNEVKSEKQNLYDNLKEEENRKRSSEDSDMNLTKRRKLTTSLWSAPSHQVLHKKVQRRRVVILAAIERLRSTHPEVAERVAKLFEESEPLHSVQLREEPVSPSQTLGGRPIYCPKSRQGGTTSKTQKKEKAKYDEDVEIVASLLKNGKFVDLEELLNLSKDYNNLKKLEIDLEEKKSGDHFNYVEICTETNIDAWGDLESLDKDIDKYIFNAEEAKQREELQNILRNASATATGSGAMG